MGMLILSAFLFLNPGPCDNWTKVEQCFVATAEFMRDKPDPWFDEAQGVWWVRGSANSKLKMDAEGMVLGLT